jgi:transposase
VTTIREYAVQGKSVRAIARELGLSRNSVRKVLRNPTEALSRPRRASKLDPYAEQIREWVEQDHLLNCQTMLSRLRAHGYTGQISILKEFVHPLRPPAASKRQPVIRYETPPGEQMQFDWGEFVYEQQGQTRKLFGFTAILSYSRLRFLTFVKRTDAASLVGCLLAAFEAFGGLPRAVLTDRMKTVLLEMETGVPRWHPQFHDLMSALQISPRVCKPYTPQTKGKVERSIRVVKEAFWPGVRFVDLPDLRRQAAEWCAQLNARVHQTTHECPVDRWAAEGLRELPQGWAWERFTAEERQVSWDGFISYDGVLYGLPSHLGHLTLAGRRVQVTAWHELLRVYVQGQLVLSTPLRSQSGQVVSHPEQFVGLLPAASARRTPVPLGHQIPAPVVAQRPLWEYDQLCGVVGSRGGTREVAS